MIKQYFDFEILIQPDGRGYSLDIEARPFIVNLPEPVKVPGKPFADAAAPSSPASEADLAELGKEFFDRIFSGEVGRAFAQYRALKTASPHDGGVRVCVNTNQNVISAALWEGLCEAISPDFDFLALDPRTPVVRATRTAVAFFERPLRLPLRILVVLAAPRWQQPIDAAKERATIEAALGYSADAAVAHVEFLGFEPDERVGFETLQEKIAAADPSYDIVHIIAHGLLERAKPGKIALVDERNNTDVVEAQDLAGILRSRQVMLVILQSCFSGAVDPTVPRFTGMAQALMAAGVPAVLAFRPAVRQDVARTFLGTLYHRWLSSGRPLEDAMTQARQNVRRDTKNAAWTEPVLYIRPGLHLDISREDAPSHTNQRLVDAALPAVARVGRAVELVVRVRPPGGRGLRDLIASSPGDFDASPEDTRTSGEFGVHFPRDERGMAHPGKVRVRVESEDLLEAPVEKIVEVPPGESSVQVHFDLLPRQIGDARVLVRILEVEGEATLGEIRLRTKVVDSEEPGFVARYQVMAGKEEARQVERGHVERATQGGHRIRPHFGPVRDEYGLPRFEVEAPHEERQRPASLADLLHGGLDFVRIGDLGPAGGCPERPRWASRMGQDRYGVFAELVLAPRVVTRLRWIPPGTFIMGSPEDEPGRWPDEGPQHRVTLTKGYWLADAPCTQVEWQALMGTNPSDFKGEARPVEYVTWDDCQAFCRRLRERFPGLQARLPSEAEWEYACRAGTTTPFNDGTAITREEDLAPGLTRLGWFGDNSHGETQPVRGLEHNRWGLYDMHGNVWEWCNDWFGEHSAEQSVDPVGPAEGPVRVYRGGSWVLQAQYCRSAYRFGRHPSERLRYLGFRLASGQ